MPSTNWPASPAFTAANFKINTPVLSTNTISGMTRRVAMGHSYYTLSAKYTNLSRAGYSAVAGYVSQLYGSLESFKIVIPELSYSKVSNQTTNPVYTAGANALAGADSVAVTGVIFGRNLLAAGDFFRFNNHSKVYMCSVTWTSGQPLYFSGSLVKDVPSGTEIIINAVDFTMILDNDVQQFDIGNGGITQAQFDMKEVWL